ncbi:MAG: hypothetical protein IPO08_13865 [Xanthomonadales bacterium]|nr:hypothetical protein [Xanthomonadales bacterium]
MLPVVRADRLPACVSCLPGAETVWIVVDGESSRLLATDPLAGRRMALGPTFNGRGPHGVQPSTAADLAAAQGALL